MNEPECLRVPLDVYPRMNRFVLDWLAGNPKATGFLPREHGAPRPSAARAAGGGGAPFVLAGTVCAPG